MDLLTRQREHLLGEQCRLQAPRYRGTPRTGGEDTVTGVDARAQVAISHLRARLGDDAHLDIIEEALTMSAYQTVELLGALRCVGLIASGHLAALSPLEKDADAGLSPWGQSVDVDQPVVVDEAG